MFAFKTVVVSFTIHLLLVTMILAPKDEKSLKPTKKNPKVVEKSTKSLRERLFDLLHDALDFFEEIVDRVLVALRLANRPRRTSVTRVKSPKNDVRP